MVAHGMHLPGGLGTAIGVYKAQDLVTDLQKSSGIDI